MLNFDSYKYIKELKAEGVPENIAEVHAKQFKNIIENDLATKVDIAKIQKDMKELELRINANTDRKIAEAKNELIKWVVGMFLAQSALLFTLFRFFLE